MKERKGEALARPPQFSPNRPPHFEVALELLLLGGPGNDPLKPTQPGLLIAAISPAQVQVLLALIALPSEVWHSGL